MNMENENEQVIPASLNEGTLEIDLSEVDLSQFIPEEE